MRHLKLPAIPAAVFTALLILKMVALPTSAFAEIEIETGVWRFVVHSSNYVAGWAIDSETNSKQWINQSCRQRI